MKDVCCAIIKNEKGEILIAQKSKGKFKNKWEFVGGKVEKGENHEDALVREIKEELGIHIIVGDFFMSNIHKYDNQEISLSAYFAEIKLGEIVLHEHHKIEWVKSNMLTEYDLLEADQPIAEKLNTITEPRNR